MDRVVTIAAATSCNFETIANFNALDRLDAHDCLSQQCINLAIPVHM